MVGLIKGFECGDDVSEYDDIYQEYVVFECRRHTISAG